MASYTKGTWTKGHTLSAADLTSLETRIQDAFTKVNSVPDAVDDNTYVAYPNGWVLTTAHGGGYEWKDPSPGYFHYIESSYVFEYVGPYDAIEEIQQWYSNDSRLGTDMFLFVEENDQHGYQSSGVYRLTDIQNKLVTDSYDNTFYVWHFVFTRVYYNTTTSKTILQTWTLCPSMNDANSLDEPFVIGEEPSQENPMNVAMYEEYVLLEGDILSYSKGGTGTNSLKTLSQKMFKQCADDGSDDLQVLTTYPVNKPGVYRVGQPNITGLPTGISGYGCLVIFNGGSYWLHMYMDSNNGIYFARKDSTAVPTTWYKATTSSVAAKT